MPRTQFIAIALAGTAFAAVPANAGGPSGGRAANCLCQTANSLTSGVSSAGANSIVRGTRQHGVVARGSNGKLIANRSVRANMAGSVTKIVDVRVAKSAGRHGGGANANIGLAGRVSGATGLSHGKSMAGQVVRIGNVSVLNKASGKGRSLVNVAVLNSRGGTSGKLANVSVLNKTGATGRSAVNVAALNGSGGTSGRIANVSVLNKTGSSGRSAANVAALNGSTGGTGRLANVSVLNGRHGNGNGGLRLPNGVQIINGVPCGPDGKPLTGAAAAAVKAMIGGNGGTSGRVVNVSVLNKTGTTGRSAVNIAALNGSGGTSGKIVNVSVLNKRGTKGHSAVNVAALNGSSASHGKIANVAALNGAGGVPSLGLPSLGCKTGCSSSSGGGGSSGGGSSVGNGSQGGSGSGGGSAAGGGSQGGSGSPSAPSPSGRPIDPAVRADHKVLWWPQQTEGGYRDGRLNDL
jgi:hypothetical protein